MPRWQKHFSISQWVRAPEWAAGANKDYDFEQSVLIVHGQSGSIYKKGGIASVLPVFPRHYGKKMMAHSQGVSDAS